MLRETVLVFQHLRFVELQKRPSLAPLYKIIRYQLYENDFEIRRQFSEWFDNHCNNRRFLANFVIGDEAGFSLNGSVYKHNVRMYAPVLLNHRIFSS